MPHATAKVDGITIADTDSYEVVEGNIYVSHRSGTPSVLPNLWPLDMTPNVLSDAISQSSRPRKPLSLFTIPAQVQKLCDTS
jgi:hypothetical protein